MSPHLNVPPPSSPLPSNGEMLGDDAREIKILQEASVHSGISTRSCETKDTNSQSTDGHGLKGLPVSFNPDFALKPRKLRIITIGAGFSGLLIAHKFQHRFPELQEFVNHTIFESRSDIGGTWLVNTYPGVQCDVPSHIYVSHTR